MAKIKGFDPWWKTPKFVVPLLIVAVVVGFLVIRSRDQPDARTESLQGATYCQAARQFDELAGSTGASSTAGSFDGSAEILASFARQAGPILADLESTAPSEVRSDVEMLSSAVEDASGGDLAALTGASVGSARARLTAHQTASCTLGSSSGEG